MTLTLGEGGIVLFGAGVEAGAGLGCGAVLALAARIALLLRMAALRAALEPPCAWTLDWVAIVS
jgi:hypothetical protein